MRRRSDARRHRRPTFGHVLAFGAGGTLVELLADVAFRIHPLTETDVDDIIQQTRVAKLLTGIRGTAPSDIPALREAILRLSTLITICPEIRDLDINPLKVLGTAPSPSTRAYKWNGSSTPNPRGESRIDQSPICGEARRISGESAKAELEVMTVSG